MTTGLKTIFPMCSKAARMSRIAAIWDSSKRSTFMADLISANSLASFLPSQVVVLPWMNASDVNNYVINENTGGTLLPTVQTY